MEMSTLVGWFREETRRFCHNNNKKRTGRQRRKATFSAKSSVQAFHSYFGAIAVLANVLLSNLARTLLPPWLNRHNFSRAAHQHVWRVFWNYFIRRTIGEGDGWVVGVTHKRFSDSSLTRAQESYDPQPNALLHLYQITRNREQQTTQTAPANLKWI